MFKILFSLFSFTPNFRGKFFLLEHFYQLFLRGTGTLTSRTWTGVKLSLYMEDRIQRRIFIKKSHELETEVHILKLAQNAGGFLDIGANIGYFSLMLAHRFPNMPVYSFEPNPNNLKRIDINAKLNNLSNIKICNLCVSNVPGKVVFAVPPENESGWGRMDTSELPGGIFTKVTSEADTLDNLLSKGFFGDIKPNLIKIDIEGSEEKAFRGATEFIKKFRPSLCVELNESCLIANDSSSLQMMTLLQSWGYEAFYISDDQLKSTKVPIKNYSYLNYFFLPQKSANMVS